MTLKHVIRSLPGAGMVLVLDTGATITAEDLAMLQALYSRSPDSILNHLEKLRKVGSGKFMESYYVGYGHASIGDCGSTAIFIEGVSMLCAKAIQDWQLYSGQECSTRYIDFANQPFVDPVGSKLSEHILSNWRQFYVEHMPAVVAHLKAQFPRDEGESETKYEKAIAARAFDIMRGFLPAGAMTNLSWMTNLRQARDKIDLLMHHPLEEVRVVATAIESALGEMHPHSGFDGKHRERYTETEFYRAQWCSVDTFFDTDREFPEFALRKSDIDPLELSKHRCLFEHRPPKTDLPNFLGELGQVSFNFLLDFGSFRDIQRHRAVLQRMPLLTRRYGFHKWYTEQLPERVQDAADELLRAQSYSCQRLEIPSEDMQYYIPMGYQTANRVTGTLPKLVYLIELRASSLVHPTLAERAAQMGEALVELLGGCGLVLHLDDDPGRFNIKRGEQDIVAKSE